MSNKKKKKHAYSGTLRNQKGFTLLSLLLTISIVFITVPFLEYITKSLDYTTNYIDLSYYQLFHFMRDDIIRSTDYSIDGRTLSLNTIAGTTVSYDQYKDIVRRQVDGAGHEIFIQKNVADLSFEKLSYGVKAIITTEDGEVYEKKFTVYQ